MDEKSTVEEIRARFDNDVERFSNLSTGQTTTVDAALTLELVISAAARCCPNAKEVLDVGCGAGNFTLKLLERIPDFNATLVDLSRPMLDRAVERIQCVSRGKIETHQSDIRQLKIEDERFEVILAAAVLHHLRTDDEWKAVFENLYRSLKPGGTIWISDLIIHDYPRVQSLMQEQYGVYLVGLKDAEYRDHVFKYIAKEDSPKSVNFQTRLLEKIGFDSIEILHKNSLFAAFGASKPRQTVEP